MGQNPGDNRKIIKVPQEETFPTSGKCKWGDMWRAHKNDSLHLGFWHTKGPNAVMHLSLIAHLLSPAQEGQKQDVESGKEIKKENKSQSGQRLRKPFHPPIFQAFGPEWVSSWHGGMEGVVGTLKLDEKLKPWYRTGLTSYIFYKSDISLMPESDGGNEAMPQKCPTVRKNYSTEGVWRGSGEKEESCFLPAFFSSQLVQ